MPVKKSSSSEVSTDAFLEVFKILEKEEKSLSEIEIPDPNQLSIPSESVVRDDFTTRMEKLIKSKRNLTLPGILAGIETTNIGTEIVLSQILKQLNALPAENFGDAERNMFLPSLDIMKFFPKEDVVSKLDIILGRLRSGPTGPIIDTEI